ncbi:asparagine synthase-related protein [Streptomyces antimycoticus]|uniref:asparagine synthase-related protein n=1 Tax=Streptomyces antimycoticus TaxID=68175 RepID=UPI0034435A3C
MSGIHIAAPYLDNEVLRLCLAVPAAERAHPGSYKPLLRGMREVVPDFVLNRRTKGLMNSICFDGIRRYEGAIRVCSAWPPGSPRTACWTPTAPGRPWSASVSAYPHRWARSTSR